MIDVASLVADPYNRKARLQPVLLVLLPSALVFVACLPELESSFLSAVGIIAYCGGAMWLTQAGRDRGKDLESGLFASWGGKPSVAMLRHRDVRCVKVTKQRYRAFLEERVPGLMLADREEEEQTPTEADVAYESATDWLLSQTRDRDQFRLIFEENVNYGFRRNLLALRPFAIGLDGLVIGGFVILGVLELTGLLDAATVMSPMVLWLMGLVAVHLFAFVKWVRADWVRVAAEAFARQLLAACDVLDAQGPRSFSASSAG